MRILAFALAALCAAPALADIDYFVSNQGHQYGASFNASGAVLTSRYPTAWFIEAGAMSRVETGTDVHYLGRSCDAQHKLWGGGKWWWANGGFGIDYDGGFQVRFPRQELPMENAGECRL